MKNNTLINKYNKKNRLIIISEYTPSIKGSTGLARFASNTAESLGNKLIIITNRAKDQDEISESDDNLLIRCFEKNRFLTFFNIFAYLLRLNKVKTVLFEFEFASYGNIFVVGLLPLLVLLMKIIGKKVFFALHQVTDDLKRLNRHLGLAKNSPFLSLLNIGLGLFYWILGLLSEKVIVLEEEFKSRLSKFIKEDKILLIPHGVESLKALDNFKTRREMKLGRKDFVILVFGYIAWYKGLDRLIEVFNHIPATFQGKRVKLVIAGGYSQAQAGRDHYERHFQSVMEKARGNKRVIVTGFVPEDKIKDYYSVADLCLAPYREFVSSSGPLSLALSFQKPVILSQELRDYKKSADFKKALSMAKLHDEELFIEISAESLKQVVQRLTAKPSYKKKLVLFSSSLRRLRSWKRISRQYGKIIVNKRAKRLALPGFNFNFKIKDLLIRYNLN